MFLTTGVSVLLTLLLAVNGVSSQEDYDFEYSDYYDEPVPYVVNNGDVSPLIINGTKATEGQIPYQVLLSTTNLGTLLCGGSLISDRHVLTAAHCVRGLTEVYVFLGSVKHPPTGTPILVPSTSIVIHPDYDSNDYQNDIAVIKLDNAVTTNDNIKPVLLPRIHQRFPVHFLWRMGRISGWGFTSTTGTGAAPSEDLMYADVRIASNLRCRNEVRRPNRGDWFNRNRTDVFKWNQICTRDWSSAGVCFGDSGGPLVVNQRHRLYRREQILVGIISFLYGDSCENALYGYTFVGAYLRWIEDVTGIRIRGRWPNDHRRRW